MTFYVAFLLIARIFWHIFAVEVRQGTLWLRFGREHWASRVAVEEDEERRGEDRRRQQTKNVTTLTWQMGNTEATTMVKR